MCNEKTKSSPPFLNLDKCTKFSSDMINNSLESMTKKKRVKRKEEKLNYRVKNKGIMTNWKKPAQNIFTFKSNILFYMCSMVQMKTFLHMLFSAHVNGFVCVCFHLHMQLHTSQGKVWVWNKRDFFSVFFSHFF